jgi:hypothetical protein
MATRTRNFLIDNTLGKVFTNVKSVFTAGPANLIAGTKLLTKSITTSAATQVRPTKNLSNVGFYFPTDSLVTSGTLKFTRVPSGGSNILRFKMGQSYSTATVILDNVVVAAKTPNFNFTLNTTVPAGNYIYVDIVAAGTTLSLAGAGLSISVNYYGN